MISPLRTLTTSIFCSFYLFICFFIQKSVFTVNGYSVARIVFVFFRTAPGSLSLQSKLTGIENLEFWLARASQILQRLVVNILDTLVPFVVLALANVVRCVLHDRPVGR